MFRKQVERVFETIQNKQNKIVMLKSWNEWAEGNYMEPDTINGKEFILALGSVVYGVNG